MINMRDHIDQAIYNAVCEPFQRTNRKWREMIRSEDSFFPLVLGNYTHTINSDFYQSVQYNKMAEKGENWYWIIVGPYIELFGNFLSRLLYFCYVLQKKISSLLRYLGFAR